MYCKHDRGFNLKKKPPEPTARVGADFSYTVCCTHYVFIIHYRFDNLDNSNAAKKPNHVYNNNNNNNTKTNNMMGVVNPAVLEKWMMEERYGK